MSNEHLFNSPNLPPKQEVEESDLLQDLRNIIVTDDSEGMKELLSIVGALQAKLQDQRGLISLLKPAITAVIKENIKEDPNGLKEAIRPIVEEIIQQYQMKQDESNPPPQEHKIQHALRAITKKTHSLVTGLRPQKKQMVEESLIPQQEPEICDADFDLLELFLLARPSMVLLAHGSWQSSQTQAEAKELLLPQLRTFIQTKEKEETTEPLRANFGQIQIHIEPTKYSYLIVLYRGTPPIGFFFDIRQSLSDIQTRFAPSLRRAKSIPSYRPILRLLLDRYRHPNSRIGNQTNEDPIKWPPPEKSTN